MTVEPKKDLHVFTKACGIHIMLVGFFFSFLVLGIFIDGYDMAFVMGLLFLVVLFISPIMLILGIIASISTIRHPSKFRGRSVNAIGLGILFVCNLLIIFIVIIGSGTPVKKMEQHDICSQNLKRLGLSFKMYARKTEGGYYPKVDLGYGKIILDISRIYPEYATSITDFLCPTDQAEKDWNPEIDGISKAMRFTSFAYIGHAITTDKEGLALLDAYRKAIRQGESLNQDLPAPPGLGSAGSDTFYRLRKDIEETISQPVVDDTNTIPTENALGLQSIIPVMMERRMNHKPDGGHVLYLDGHVAFTKLGDKFPYSETFYNALLQFEADLPELRNAYMSVPPR